MNCVFHWVVAVEISVPSIPWRVTWHHHVPSIVACTKMCKGRNTGPQGAVEWGDQTREHRHDYTTGRNDKYEKCREVEQKREWLTSFGGQDRLPRWDCWARLWRNITKVCFQWKAGYQREGRMERLSAMQRMPSFLTWMYRSVMSSEWNGRQGSELGP